MDFENSIEFANKLDSQDELKGFRQRFLFPQFQGEDVVYFCGNSLGLQPKGVADAFKVELDDWGAYGVDGHFDARNPWYSYHEFFSDSMANLVGAKPSEVVAMNGLTVNLHLLMISFYRPEGKRVKILCEGKAFPSDDYALESQVKLHGLIPEDVIVEVNPREGEHVLRDEDILTRIDELGDELAMVMFGGVNYYTGQVLDMKAITERGHGVGAIVGFDLAHAAGNLKMDLHGWGLDFAAWCSYKYLNSGPGSVAGAFVHERHENNPELKRLAGWWGYEPKTRFKMEKGFIPQKGAAGWQLSNAPVFTMVPYRVSLDIFDEAKMDRLTAKSKLLTAYLQYVINSISSQKEQVDFEIITPSEEGRRGCQLSILVHGKGKELHNFLNENGVISDWREPNVIRIAPVPLYNSFKDVFRFGEILKKAIN